MGEDHRGKLCLKAVKSDLKRANIFSNDWLRTALCILFPIKNADVLSTKEELSSSILETLHATADITLVLVAR